MALANKEKGKQTHLKKAAPLFLIANSIRQMALVNKVRRKQYPPEESSALVSYCKLCPPDGSGQGRLVLVAEQLTVLLNGPVKANLLN